MRILALGDVHLGASPDLGRVPFGEGSRLDDQRKVLARVVDLVEDEGVDLVLFAGDAFHRRRPTPSEILAWRGFVERLNLGGVDMIAIDGNHDVESAERPSALLTVRTTADYEVSRQPRIFFPTSQIAVATLPWTPPARLIASLNGSVERDEVSARVAELLIDSARELRNNIAGDKTAILLAHWSVSGSSLPNGLPVDLLREPVLPLPDLEALGFDAVVLGHIHQPQQLTQWHPDGTPIFYTGSPAVVDFGEAATEHGVWILDFPHPGMVETPTFHPIEDRRFVTVDCDLVGEITIPDCDETDLIAAAIAEHFPLTDAVVRIRYRATSEQARRVDVAALRSLCADAGVSKVFQIVPDIVRTDRARVEGLTEQVSVPAALDLYLGAQDPPVEAGRAEALRTLNAELLDEVIA